MKIGYKHIGSKALAKIIYHKRLKGSIPFDKVYTAIKILSSEMFFNLVNDIPITVKNFGTLSPYVFHGHKACNWGSENNETKPTRRVRLHASDGFKELVTQYRDDLKKVENGG